MQRQIVSVGGSLGSADGMVETPWGPSDSLRDRMLRPGPGTPSDDVASNQRGRLFGAMVASVSERGYAATRLSDLSELSGVSRNSFYSLFADKKACFVAALEALLAMATNAVEDLTGTWAAQVRTGAAGFAQLVVAQPAAARMCLIEAFAVGAEGLKPLETATARFEAHAMKMVAEPPGQAGMPPEMITADVGAILEITRNLLRQGKEAELPELMKDYADLVLSHRPPPEPLRLTTRPPTPAPESIDAHDHGERALRAFAVVAAEKGYANLTINQVCKRASMSPTTFYANFRDKEDALMAAIDSAGAQMVAAILPPFRRNPDWQHGVRAAMGALFNFLASRPSLAQLVLVEVHAAGPDAVERREEALRPLDVLVAEGRARSPQVPPIAIATIKGGIYALAYKQIRDSGPESLPALAPIGTYLALAPFVGPEEACAAANGDGRGRGSTSDLPDRFLLSKVLVILSKRPIAPEEISTLIGTPADEVRHVIDELLKAGLIRPVEDGNQEGSQEQAYQAKWHWIEHSEWDQMSLTERQRLSRQIGHLVTGEVDLALETGTFDARVDRHLSRVPLLVDEQGWRELMGIHHKAFLASLEVQAESAERLKQTDKPGIDGRSVQIMFEVPRSDFESPEDAWWSLPPLSPSIRNDS